MEIVLTGFEKGEVGSVAGFIIDVVSSISFEVAWYLKMCDAYDQGSSSPH